MDSRGPSRRWWIGAWLRVLFANGWRAMNSPRCLAALMGENGAVPASMGGTVEIRSAKGFGTTMAISLPLTLAILDGMSVKVGEEVYILPLGYVIESLQPAPEDVKEIAGQGRVVKVRSDYLPLIPLHQIFAIEPRFTEPSLGIVVILESDGKKAALLVDALVGQQQVVVKNLESNFRKVAGISGATILGDGGVSLILDVSALLRSSRQLNAAPIFS